MKLPALRSPLLARVILLGAHLLALGRVVHSQPAEKAEYTPQECPNCREWNQSSVAQRLHGSTYYVGTRGLSAILIASSTGHILLDGGLPESAPKIAANVRALGFRVEDVKVIVNSHEHFDHAGGIAALQRASGARVMVSPRAARALRAGNVDQSDPQFKSALPYPPVSQVLTLHDGDTIRVGELAIIAHFTPGHAPGGTSWTWRSCEGPTCLDFVYADSQTAVSDDDFFFSRSTTYPTAVSDFQRTFTVVESLPCDVLLTPHPSASQMWERIASGGVQRDATACRTYASTARARFQERLAKESRPSATARTPKPTF